MIDPAGFGAAFAAARCCRWPTLVWARRVPREAPRRAGASRHPRGAAWELLRGAGLRRLLLVNWFMSASWDVHTFLVPVLGNQRGLSASAIGSMLGVFAIAVTVVRLVIPCSRTG